MNYRKALLSPRLIMQDNVDSVMVAPQGKHETSCDPKNNKFTVVLHVKNRRNNGKKTIISIHEDANIPHVKNIGKKLQVNNYEPTSLYTARKMAHSKQSHRSVEQGETRQARRRQKIHQQSKTMRTEKLHHNHIYVNEKFKEHLKCSECNNIRRSIVNDTRNKDLQAKLKSSIKYFFHTCEKIINKKMISIKVVQDY